MNVSAKLIVKNMVKAAVALFFNGLGVYLTIHASIGAGPWDVLNLGLVNTFGVLYENASIAVSLTILVIDIVMREPIGIAMFIDALVVGKAVDFFNYLNAVPVPGSLVTAVSMMLIGLAIMGYTQYQYMSAALGCGPRDTLLVGIAKRLPKIPIGAVSVALLSAATLAGFLLGGPVGIGTIICAFCCGPIMQFEFKLVHFDASAVSHQRLNESVKIIIQK